MACTIGIPKETAARESRVAITPEIAKKLISKKYKVRLESGAGDKAGFPDTEFEAAGVEVVRDRVRQEAFTRRWNNDSVIVAHGDQLQGVCVVRRSRVE